MKRKAAIIVIVVALIGGAVGIAWLYFALNPAAWHEFVAQMQGSSTGSTAPRPVRRPVSRSAQLVASGNIEAEEVNVAAEIGGRIVEMRVDEGDQVSAGEMLIQLDPTVLLAQREQALAAVAQAQAAVDAAQAQLDQAQAGARPEEIAAARGVVAEAQSGSHTARGQLAAAEADLQVAQAQLSAAEAAESAAEAEVKAAQAELEGAGAQVSTSQARVEQARAQLAEARDRDPTPNITAAQVAVERAEIALEDAQDEYRESFDRPWEDQALRDAAAKRLKQVQLDYQLAQAQLDGARKAQQAYVLNLEALAAQVKEAEAQLTPAGVDSAEAHVAQAQAGVNAAEVHVVQARGGVQAAQAAVTIAQAGVEAAQARLDQAQAQLDLLQAGARQQEISLLQANVVQARALLSNAQAALQMQDVQLARLKLVAPAGGIVLDRTIHVGDAYQDVFAGMVSHIASQAEFTPKNVQTQEERVHMVFAVKIRLENADHRLKPGMPADAAFE
jgi:multidrug resistance efflux pump